MKKAIYFVVISVLLSSCYTPRVVFNYQLKEVERHKQENIEYFDPVEEYYNFEDEYIKVSIQVKNLMQFQTIKEGFRVEVFNKTEDIIVQHFDLALYIDEDTVTYSIPDGNNIQTSIVIARKSKTINFIYPFSADFYSFSNSKPVATSYLIMGYVHDKKEFELIKNIYRRKTIQLHIPFTVKDSEINYYFIFNIIPEKY
jgi:hypothetical protein